MKPPDMDARPTDSEHTMRADQAEALRELLAAAKRAAMVGLHSRIHSFGNGPECRANCVTCALRIAIRRYEEAQRA